MKQKGVKPQLMKQLIDEEESKRSQALNDQKKTKVGGHFVKRCFQSYLPLSATIVEYGFQINKFMSAAGLR